MKTGVLATKNIVSDDLKSEKSIMGMSMKGMEMAQYFLRDKIYSDKVLAVIREYISNAQDEHLKHGIDKNVDICLATVNGEYRWSVRDYALGLNEHDIRNVFAMYFESTKSNDNDAIGGFGVGGKAAFAYTDTFYVTSYHEGTKTSYICTLGGGQQGIPIGEIYKTGEELTSEQGIEVSIEIKSEDYYTFSNKTITFVSCFLPDAKLFFNNGTTVTVPAQPIQKVEMHGFIVNGYDNFLANQYGASYCVRMGGVIYPYKTSIKVHRNRSSKLIVVDVPIGKLTIPISRESIENLPSNERVFQEIEDILDKIAADELTGLVAPKFGNVVSKNEKHGQDYMGQWFNYPYSKTFPSTYKHINKILRGFNDPHGHDSNIYEPLEPDAKSGKHVIYVFPNLKGGLKDWHTRLRAALQYFHGADYKGYLWTYVNYADEIKLLTDSSIDTSDISWINVKDLKLKKIDRIPKAKNEKFLVYGRYFNGKSFPQDSYSIEDIDDWVTANMFKGDEPEDDWYLDVTEEYLLNARTVALTTKWGTRTHFFTANSVKLVDGLYKLGWLNPDSQEYKDQILKIKVERDKKQQLISLEADARHIIFRTSVRNHTIKALKSKPDRLNKLKSVREALLKEVSPRGRILKAINHQYYCDITREDLRKIMLLKD